MTQRLQLLKCKKFNINAFQLNEYSNRDIFLRVTMCEKVIDYEAVFYRILEYSVRMDK